jgi:hypothetical protein
MKRVINVLSVTVLLIAIGWSFLYFFVGSEITEETASSIDINNSARLFLEVNGIGIIPEQKVTVYPHIIINESNRPTLSIVVANKTHENTSDPDNYENATWYEVDPVPGTIQISYLPEWWNWDENGRLGVIKAREIPIRFGSLKILSAVKYPELNSITISEWADKNMNGTNITRTKEQEMEKIRESSNRYSVLFPQW